VALRRNLTAYDAVYVALAEVLGAVLLTSDLPLSRTPGLSARVVLVPINKETRYDSVRSFSCPAPAGRSLSSFASAPR